VEGKEGTARGENRMTIFIRRKMQTIIKYKTIPRTAIEKIRLGLHKTATTLNNWKRTNLQYNWEPIQMVESKIEWRGRERKEG